ncbi:trimethyllysine dioxygenase, mitochondrial [Eupeodes corollae]|uniref:trimethyllysine dioxygenase, mitochondrial n=1 Tax=Eupeodes corollae TaxID=290404 RepID=UPI0024936507|nr:trimethyllysine dioxygenase, mitochondrial [Eupeodes corollae]XP_055915917.1 trimethyllysine dioxygenase, mitochondrial [Eupeodes corollae]
MIEVKCLKSIEPALQLNEFWLRDHCRCEKCYNTDTKQRKFSLLDLPDDVSAEIVITREDEQNLFVKWNDGHESTYSFEFLKSCQLENYLKAKDSSEKILWDSSVIAKNNYADVKLSDLIRREDDVCEVVGSLWYYGIALVEEVPANQTMTEMAIRRVFPVMKTFFGEMYTFSDANDLAVHADTAYTKEYIGPHTDNTYFCDAAGLQILHCIHHEGTGGENFFVDGFKVATELKRINPKAFDILTKVLVPAEYIEEGQFHVHHGPIIRTNPITGEIIQIRLNIYDRAALNTLAQSEMKAFYQSLKEFLRLVEKTENQWTMKLNPGTVVMYDNWRILHARRAYTGNRTMTGCYVQRADFLSKARVLGIID